MSLESLELPERVRGSGSQGLWGRYETGVHWDVVNETWETPPPSSVSDTTVTLELCLGWDSRVTTGPQSVGASVDAVMVVGRGLTIPAEEGRRSGVVDVSGPSG